MTRRSDRASRPHSLTGVTARLKTFTAMVVALLCAASVASATPILTFNEATGSDGINQGQSVGWQFDVLSAITVTGLGWFDENGDGLGREHTVGIWDGSGTLLTSALVPAGSAAGFDGQFRTVATAPIVLLPGAGYIVGGQNFSDSGDRLAFDVTFTTDASIQFVDATFSDFGGFQRPANFSVATSGFYGPSFSISQVTVPDQPSTLLLFGTAAAALLRKARRRRQ